MKTDHKPLAVGDRVYVVTGHTARGMKVFSADPFVVENVGTTSVRVRYPTGGTRYVRPEDVRRAAK